jgi:hypothetical protein
VVVVVVVVVQPQMMLKRIEIAMRIIRLSHQRSIVRDRRSNANQSVQRRVKARKKQIQMLSVIHKGKSNMIMRWIKIKILRVRQRQDALLSLCLLL